MNARIAGKLAKHHLVLENTGTAPDPRVWKKSTVERARRIAQRHARRYGDIEGMKRAVDEVVTRVIVFFGGDITKAKRWIASPNPLLGEMTPAQMIRLGRGEKLLRFVRQQLAANQQ